MYGSDAISGVINFILKKKIDGTTLNFRVGDTQHGGGASQRVQFTSGFSNGKFDSVFALEVSYKQPLWAYQRSFTDSRLDSPGDPSRNYRQPGVGTHGRGRELHRSRPGNLQHAVFL